MDCASDTGVPLGSRSARLATSVLFARGTRKGWVTWGNQADADYRPTWKTYPHHSAAGRIDAAE
jgi:hypothetical protein